MKLEKFANEFKCQKCNSMGQISPYVSGKGHISFPVSYKKTSRTEHLEVSCAICGFKWKMACG